MDLKSALVGYVPGECDKCQRSVHPGNDVIVLEFVRTGNPMFLFATSRHLLPEKDGDTIVCQGSPSRAQYLEGQPRDSRSEYAYDPDNEAETRAVYAELQRIVA